MIEKNSLRNSRNTRFLKRNGDRPLLILPERITDSTGLSLQNTGRDDKMLQYFLISLFYNTQRVISPNFVLLRRCVVTEYSNRALRTSTPSINDMMGKTGMVDSFNVSLSLSFIRKKRVWPGRALPTQLLYPQTRANQQPEPGDRESIKVVAFDVIAQKNTSSLTG